MARSTSSGELTLQSHEGAVLSQAGTDTQQQPLGEQFFRLLVQSVKDYAILMLDPTEPIILETMSANLKSQGFVVRTAEDGFAARLRQMPPDIIISDLRMPNMSGSEFLSVVRRRFPHIPVIADGRFPPEGQLHAAAAIRNHSAARGRLPDSASPTEVRPCSALDSASERELHRCELHRMSAVVPAG